MKDKAPTPHVSNSAHTFGVAGICAIAACLVLSIVLVFLALKMPRNLPWDIDEHLLLAPQYLFSFRDLVKPVSYGIEPVFSLAGAWAFGIVLWGVVAAVYGWVTRRLPRFAVFLLAPIAIIVITILVHSVFHVMGYYMDLDGP